MIDTAKLKKCVTNLPDHVLVGECWDLNDKGEYVLSRDSTYWVYKDPNSEPGHERVHFHKGVA